MSDNVVFKLDPDICCRHVGSQEMRQLRYVFIHRPVERITHRLLIGIFFVQDATVRSCIPARFPFYQQINAFINETKKWRAT